MSLLDRQFARVYDRAMAPAEDAGLADARRRLLAPLAGTVVEIGAGTGLNVPHLPPTVQHLLATEPKPHMAAQLRTRAAGDDRVEVVEAPGHALPLPDGAADHAIATLVLCTVPDVEATLRELARVVRPGGTLALIEHVASDHPGWHRVQRLIQPVWRVAARGCHLTRHPVGALRDHGFDTAGVQRWQVPGSPPVSSPALAGHATRV